MTAAVAYQGRLPGLRVDPALPRRADDAIRLDVAAFVGFAARGPAHLPQVVEDPSQYATVFGGDLPLAIDEHGAPVHAALPDAVRSFFDNGGRRAYVVRVVGPDAVVLDVPVRVPSRLPLGDGLAVVDLDLDGVPLTQLPAASEGGWAAGVSVDLDVNHTVLLLTTGRDGVTDLAPASRRLLDDGDALLVWRDPDWFSLVAPAAPAGGWQQGDVVRRLRVDLTVRASDGEETTAVERFEDLRLGPGRGRARSWTDVLQPRGAGFARDRSMYGRGPRLGSDRLVARLGPFTPPITSPLEDVDDDARNDDEVVIPEPCTREALAPDDLVTFDPKRLFLDPSLTGFTVESLRLQLELLGLDDDPAPRGLHAIALEPEVAILALPDLYHRPWTEQAVKVAPDVVVVPEEPVEPVGFVTCADPATSPVESPLEPPVEPGVTSPIEPPVTAALRLVVDRPSSYDPAGLHAVALAAVDLCAARADLVTVLGLPRHAGLVEAEHLAEVIGARRSSTTDVASYAGIWHPWAAVAEVRPNAPVSLRPVPPDGAVAGTIAASELTAGLWVEPAGRPLNGILAVDPMDAPSGLAFFDRGFNLIRRRPAGFVATSAHGLSADRTLLQLSVRRLLILVRKRALRDGDRFVFEPDDDRLRALVATTFVRFLDGLRVAGALAAFQVEVEPLATRSAADEGRLRVDIKLAPTSPIEFITVTLLRSGDGLVEVRS